MTKFQLEQIRKKLFSSKEEVVTPSFLWKQECNKLIVRPENTDEFDIFIEKQIERFESAGFTSEYAAQTISKSINILYYQRHPAKHMVMLAAIL